MAKKTIQEQFEDFHAKNPHVYELFVRFTIELIKHGHKRISPRFIAERIRWEVMTKTSGSGWHVAAGKPFKINNNFSSRYGRLLIDRHPKLAKYIETRSIKTP